MRKKASPELCRKRMPAESTCESAHNGEGAHFGYPHLQ